MEIKLTDRQQEEIAKMHTKGWEFIDMNIMLKLIESDTDYVFTSKGPFLYCRLDNANIHSTS